MESSDESASLSKSSDRSTTSSSRSSRNKRKKQSSNGFFLSAKKLIKRRGKNKRGGKLTKTRLEDRLLTPRPTSESESADSSNGDVLSVASAASGDAIFVPAEGEGFDDALEESDDGDGKGDPKEVQSSNPTEGTRVQFIDCPQKAKLFHAAKKKMEEKKEGLIRSKHTIRVEVKTRHAYEFGGRVEGRARSDFAGHRGTITDVIDSERFQIQWYVFSFVPYFDFPPLSTLMICSAIS